MIQSAAYLSDSKWMVVVDGDYTWTVSVAAVNLRDGEIPRRVADWIASGGVVAAYQSPFASVDDVRSEAQRRIITLVGARDFTDCIIRQLNANMKANKLNDIRHVRTLTEVEEAQAAALRELADKIEAIRTASNMFTDPIPVDYKSDKYWPGK